MVESSAVSSGVFAKTMLQIFQCALIDWRQESDKKIAQNDLGKKMWWVELWMVWSAWSRRLPKLMWRRLRKRREVCPIALTIKSPTEHLRCHFQPQISCTSWPIGQYRDRQEGHLHCTWFAVGKSQQVQPSRTTGNARGTRGIKTNENQNTTLKHWNLSIQSHSRTFKAI